MRARGAAECALSAQRAVRCAIRVSVYDDVPSELNHGRVEKSWPGVRRFEGIEWEGKP